MKLVVTDNQARALVSINGSLNAGWVVKYVVFDENKLLGAPIGVICPRAIAEIFSIPRGVVNLHRLHPRKIELAMVNHAPQKSINTHIHRVQAIECAVVNAECV